MTCPRTEELSAFADRALSAREQTELRQHLHVCPVCRHELDALRTLTQELRALPSPDLGFDLAAQLQDRLPRPRPQPRRTGWKLADWMPAGLAAGAALVSGVWLGGLLLGTGATAAAPGSTLARVFDPSPPGGLCAAAEICRLPRGLP
jgi:anti-sigma factor RsiW